MPNIVAYKLSVKRRTRVYPRADKYEPSLQSVSLGLISPNSILNSHPLFVLSQVW